MDRSRKAFMCFPGSIFRFF